MSDMRDRLHEIAADAFKHWDSDNNLRVGKILRALAGWMPGYRSDIDTLHADLDSQTARKHDAVTSALIAAMTVRPENHHEPLHQRVERECMKQHGSDFYFCTEPGCLLLKRIANIAGWPIGVNGVQPKEAA